MKSITIINRQVVKDLKSRLNQEYSDFLEDFREQAKNGISSEFISEKFAVAISSLLFSPQLDSYDPLRFYWLTLLDDLALLVEAHEDYEEANKSEKITSEEIIFNIWNESEYAQAFSEMLQKHAPIEASVSLLTVLENQILSFYLLHIESSNSYLYDHPVLYRFIPEIGETETFITRGLSKKYFKIQDNITSLPNLIIDHVDFCTENMSIEDNDRLIKISIENDGFINLLKHKNNTIRVIGSHFTSSDMFNQHCRRITRSLDLLFECSPDLYSLFFEFTHTIIPINEQGIVSYSTQNLPGFSCINTFERGFLDLADDLLHENGHHYLNYYLNTTDLINEDDDKIYYSPWRRALRPIRGIYHATFTFYWASKLFGEMATSSSAMAILSEKQKDYAKLRYFEEYFMLKHCQPDLDDALKHEKITKEGYSLIQNVYMNIDNDAHQYRSIGLTEESLSKESQSKLANLKQLLEDKEKEYRL